MIRSCTLGIAFAVAATSAAESQQALRTVIDTVRDTIRSRTSGQLPPNRLFRLVPEWTFAASEGDATKSMGDVWDLRVGADGKVYVWDHKTPAFWVVSADGKGMTQFGRKGSGPGEYTQANGLGVTKAGRVLLWDGERRRLNVYDATGKSISTSITPFGDCCASAVTVDAQDRVWYRVNLKAIYDKSKIDPKAEPFEEKDGYIRTRPDGTVIDTVVAPKLAGDTPPMKAIRSTPTSVSGSSSVVPYSTFTQHNVSPMGHLVFTQGRPYRVYSSYNGKTLVIERETPAVAIPETERAEQRARIEWQMKRVLPDWKWTGAEIPATKPPVSFASGGGDGRIWVSLSVPSERYDPPPPSVREANPAPPIHFRRSERRWDVYEPDGRFVGQVVAPRQFQAMYMRGDFVWGVQRDEDDLPSIVKMKITPGGR